ncbi:MAG TPA: helix-turn-helix domain-containing protein [Jatrophihabitans sp.]|nr:helix-turn-helix domain-containing protein [Jatrophihabitans sp.]
MSEPVADPGADRAFNELLELVGRRWTLRILWELRDGRRSFNELRRRAGGMSQSVLVTRLTELFGAGLVADTAGGYELTPLGTAMLPDLERLRSYAVQWSRAVGR